MTEKSNHEWSREALFAKAQLYSESMAEHDDTKWKFGLWSALTLEMLVRSSVAAKSPALIADTQDWNNVLYGLGIQPKKAKFVPKSATIAEIVSRAEELLEDFSREHANFCISHFARRNSEVHSGSLPFENVGSDTWLPMYYAVCDVLLSSIGESLEAVFGREGAATAREYIAALRDETAKAVKGTINAHKTVWDQKTDEERSIAASQAETASLRHYGHRVVCPACGSRALIQGKAAGEAKLTVDEDGIHERQVMKPEAFYCLACGLKILGYSKLLAAGLGSTFVSTSHYDAIDFFNIDVAEKYRNIMEDDNNEY